MATKIFLKLVKGCFIPSSPMDVETIESLKAGQEYMADITQPRNLPFNKKHFALLNVIFEAWSPTLEEYQGIEPSKSLAVFKKLLSVLSGSIELAPNEDGKFETVPKSQKFSDMDQIEFEKLHNDIIEIATTKFSLKQGYNKKEIEEVLQKLLNF